jgi:hypothetical protein
MVVMDMNRERIEEMHTRIAQLDKERQLHLTKNSKLHFCKFPLTRNTLPQFP